MLKHLRPAVVMIAAMTIITGLVYPLAITGVLQIVARAPANGSLIVADGKVIGSELIAQSFAADRYIWPRPSAAGDNGFDASNSSGSNLGPTSAKLVARITADVAKYQPEAGAPVAADLVTTSGSGLDPHISPQAALLQVARVARARHVEEDRVATIIRAMIERPWAGLVGELRINVLRLNMALDAELPVQSG